MSDTTSSDQNAFIFDRMRNGALLPETGYEVSECVSAIRSLNDDARGRLVDDWLIAVISKYSFKVMEMPSQKDVYKLIMENCTKLAKSFGEESSSKRKTGGRNIYIRQVRTKASEAAMAAGSNNSALGAKVTGGYTTTLIDKINAEVMRQLAPKKTEADREPFIEMDTDDVEGERQPSEEPEVVTVTVSAATDLRASPITPIESQAIAFVPSDAPELPVAARRLMQTIFVDPLSDIPVWATEIDLSLIQSPLLVVEDIDEPLVGEDRVDSLTPAGTEFWTSTRAKKQSVMPHSESVNLPLAPTGMTEHKGVSVDTSELKAIKASRKRGLQIIEAAKPPPVLVSKKPLPKVFNKPLPKEKVVRTPKPVEPPLTKEQKAERRLEKRKLSLALYKQSRGE